MFHINSSNVILMELTFKCPISLFRFLTIKDLNSLFILVLFTSFLIFGVYSSFNEEVEATSCSSFCQLKMLVKALVELFCNISVPLLFKCNLLSFKYCNFKVLKWSVNKNFFRNKVQSNISLPHLLLPLNDNFVL